MRVWDISPYKLCRNHLLGEHSEIHAIWLILTKNKEGFAHHPETIRWKGKLKALYFRHEKIVQEMKKRGFNYKSPLNNGLATVKSVQNDFVDFIEDQIRILKNKNCECKI